MKRKNLFVAVFLVLFLCLFLRLGDLQILRHGALAAKGDEDVLKTAVLKESTRGAILDRNGVPLTSAAETVSLLVVPALVDDVGGTAARLAASFSLSQERLASLIGTTDGEGKAIRKTPFVAKENLTAAETARAERMAENGVFAVARQSRTRRDLPALHLIGTVRGGDGGEKAAGVSGLERIYDDVLAADGERVYFFVVDGCRRAVGNGGYFVRESDNTAGSVALTLDLEIQRAAEAALAGRSGAAVVLDCDSGDVLAMASSPKFDPLETAADAADGVYVNKALSPYPPASLFKVFLAASALERGAVSAETLFHCGGKGEETAVSCWKEEGHGFLTFGEALAQSCNPVFVDVAAALGGDALTEDFARWELGNDLLLGYPLSGRSYLHVGGGSGALANAALGESGVMMTPLNAAKMLNVIASGGLLRTPRLVTSVRDREGRETGGFDDALALPVISAETADAVTAMMVPTFETGTAASLGLGSFRIAGKTGTSETGNVWIGGFFPYERPRYTVVVLINGGTGGAKDAGPVMKKLCSFLVGQN